MATVAKRFVGDGGERARSLQREEDGDFAKTRSEERRVGKECLL